MKPVEGWGVVGREVPIYEGGQCRQSQFYSSEIYTQQHSVPAFLPFFWRGGGGRSVAYSCFDLHLRAPPILQTSFLQGNLCLHPALRLLGLYHLGKHRRAVLCHFKGYVEHAGCKGEGHVNLNLTEGRFTFLKPREETSKG